MYKRKNGERTWKDSYEIKCGRIKGNCGRSRYQHYIQYKVKAELMDRVMVADTIAWESALAKYCLTLKERKEKIGTGEISSYKND